MEKTKLRSLNRLNRRLKVYSKFNRTLRSRLLTSFILIIVISVSAFDGLLLYFVRNHYYQNMEQLLTSQIMTSADFYRKYFSSTPLEENIMNNVDAFFGQYQAQVQIIDYKGTVLLDSIGVSHTEPLITEDITKALNGVKGSWIGKVSYSESNVLAVSYPLYDEDNIVVGAIRFIASLKSVDKEINKIAVLFISLGAVIVVTVISVSIFLADSIINPIKDLTKTAKKMAMGNYQVRTKEYKDVEIYRLSDTLNHMAEEIVKRDQMKNEFIASVSHELRTPLTAIKGWSMTLNSQEIDDVQLVKDGLVIIEKECDRLSSMVEELLDFSRFISGKVNLNLEEIPTAEFLNFIEKYMQIRSTKENVSYEIDSTNAPEFFEADKNRFKQVIINVLDNAFKFTPSEGKVSLKVFILKNMIIFKVSDTGIGISEEELPKVKEKFYKGQSSKSQTGLGLSISDEIMKLHGGIIEFQSVLGKGTDVFLGLPVNKL